MSTVYNIGVLPGDGIGSEVVNEALKVLSAVEQIYGFSTRREPLPYGAELFLKTGEMMPDVAFERLRDMHAVVFGAVGDPRIEVGKLEFAIIAGLRHKLDLFVNLRPIKLYDASLCPLKDIDRYIFVLFLCVLPFVLILYTDIVLYFKNCDRPKL